ncbi:TonB-dependent receptor protein [Salinisphaera sp. PC39]|uniref:outer membrane beta-barrel protein n=1 Tax=Salinisphaera sp. PC39 TaxID=1304156 RepID=UPI0033409359
MQIRIPGYLALLALAPALGVSAPAVAQTSGLEPHGYLGGGIGYYRVEDEEFPDDDDDFKDEREAYRGFIGAMLNRYVGLEIGYTDFAEAEDGGYEADADGFTAAVLAQVPVNEAFSVYGKGGMLAWDLDVSGPLVSGSDDGEDPFYGVGTRIGLGGAFGLRLEYERFELDDTDVDLASANLEFRF